MKKLRLKLEVGKPVKLCNSYTVTRTPSTELELVEFNVNYGRAAYTIKIDGTFFSGVHGTYHDLRWTDSWITMASPIVVNVGEGRFRPDFIVKIPNSIIRE
jgi:hypothetical protein